MIILFAQNDDGGSSFIIFLIIAVVWAIRAFLGKVGQASKRKFTPPQTGEGQPRPAPTARTITLKEFLEEAAGAEKQRPVAPKLQGPPIPQTPFETGMPKPPPAPHGPVPPPPPKYRKPEKKVYHLSEMAAQEPRKLTTIDNDKRFEKKFDHLRSTIEEEVKEFREGILAPSGKIAKPVAAPYKIKKAALGSTVRLRGGTLRDAIVFSEIIQPPLSIRRARGHRR